MPAVLPCQRDRFDIPDDVAYFNCAYLSPLSTEVGAAGNHGIAAKLRPWVVHNQDTVERTESVRRSFARIVGAQPGDIALVPSAGYGMALAARNLPLRQGQRVVLLADEHPSCRYPWRAAAARHEAEIHLVPAPHDDDWTANVLDALDERVDVVAVPQLHWLDGRLLDLVAVGTRVREIGASLALDLTQSLGALPFDLHAVDPDVIACAGYKWLMGPYSYSYLYVAPRHHDGRPLEPRAASSGARRFDTGEAETNLALTPMADAALAMLLAWGVPRIAATLEPVTRAIVERAEALGLAALPPHLRAGHYLGLRFPEPPPDQLVQRLAADRVHVSRRGDLLRVTPHLYNTPEDVDRLVEGLRCHL